MREDISSRMAQPLHHSPQQRQEIVDHICDEMVAHKRSLFKVLELDEKLPSYSLVMKWQRLDEGLRDQIAQAREAALEALIEGMVEISQANNIDHNEKRVRLIAIEKTAQMLLPRRFNMKHADLTSGGEKLSIAPMAGRDRLDALVALALARAQGHAPMPMLEAPIIEGECVTLDDILD